MLGVTFQTIVNMVCVQDDRRSEQKCFAIEVKVESVSVLLGSELSEIIKPSELLDI